MEQKQTAVEYLVEQLLPKALSAEQYYHIEQAKEIEKQQIMELKFQTLIAYGVPLEKAIMFSEQYHNEKYGNET